MKKAEPSRRQKWLPYVRDVADRLKLRDWRIEIDDDADPRDCIASVSLAEARWAVISLNDSFLASSREKQRHAVAHELVYCHFAAYVKAVEKKTRDDQVLKILMEYTVDAVADAIAPLVPLPPKL